MWRYARVVRAYKVRDASAAGGGQNSDLILRSMLSLRLARSYGSGTHLVRDAFPGCAFVFNHWTEFRGPFYCRGR